MGAPATPSEQEIRAGEWASSGAMALTGRAGGPPLVAPPDVVGRVVELGERAGAEALALLGERAAVAGLTRQGDRSCGGASRLLPTADGWLVATLARDDDVELVPAWLEGGAGAGDGDPWAGVTAAAAARPGVELVERGRMLGLPVAMVASVVAPGSAGSEGPPPGGPGASDPLAGLPVTATRYGEARSGAHRRRARSSPLVVDLSSLWAGPLCARLLGGAGAEVVKVESVHRPDGARRGPGAFFDLLHAGHRSVALDLRTGAGVAGLARLVAAADVVVEASRPRALAQLGLAAEEVLGRGEGPAVWISVTGYGRDGEGRDRVAFGDDAAAAGGLVARDGAGPCFVADAVADPLSGLAGAAAARAALEAGGTWLIDVAMAGVAAHVAGNGASTGPGPAPGGGWVPGSGARPPAAPPVRGRGPALGEHTAEVLAQLPRSAPGGS